MKKIFTSIMAGTMLFAFTTSTKTTQAQAVEEGNVTLDVYYGFPNLLKSIYNATNTSSTISFSAMGPIGTKFEYMVSDKMGVGLDCNYVTMTWSEEYDNGNNGTYTDKIVYNRLRLMPRWNIHFGSSDSFDGYFGIAAGYASGKWAYTSDNPNYVSSSIPNVIPFAMRVAVGGRYYFTDNIGLHMELGFGGGAIIHGGLAFKF